MKASRQATLLCASCAALCVLVLGTPQAQALPPDPPHTGLMLGAAWNLGRSNFDLETPKDGPDLGLGFEFDVGYAFPYGFALSAEVSHMNFDYQRMFRRSSTWDSYGISLHMRVFSLWYLFDIGDSWRVYLRGGLGSAVTTYHLESFTPKPSNAWFFAGGAHWYFEPKVALWLEGFGRYYDHPAYLGDVDLERVEVFGVAIGLLWL